MREVESAKFWYCSGPINGTYRFNMSIKDTKRTQKFEQKMNYGKRRYLHYGDLHQMNNENILTIIVLEIYNYILLRVLDPYIFMVLFFKIRKLSTWIELCFINAEGKMN